MQCSRDVMGSVRTSISFSCSDRTWHLHGQLSNLISDAFVELVRVFGLEVSSST